MADENNTNSNKKIQSALNIKNKQNNVYTKQYYIMFFVIMITCFIVIYWCSRICNKKIFKNVVKRRLIKTAFFIIYLYFSL